MARCQHDSSHSHVLAPSSAEATPSLSFLQLLAARSEPPTSCVPSPPSSPSSSRSHLHAPPPLGFCHLSTFSVRCGRFGRLFAPLGLAPALILRLWLLLGSQLDLSLSPRHSHPSCPPLVQWSRTYSRLSRYSASAVTSTFPAPYLTGRL